MPGTVPAKPTRFRRPPRPIIDPAYHREARLLQTITDKLNRAAWDQELHQLEPEQRRQEVNRLVETQAPELVPSPNSALVWDVEQVGQVLFQNNVASRWYGFTYRAG